MKPAHAWTRPARVVLFALWFSWQFVLANYQVAVEVVRVRSKMAPGVLRYHMLARTNFEMATVVNLISLTPGTLTLDMDPDAAVVIVHDMFGESEDQMHRSLRDLEQRFLYAFRQEGLVE